MISRRLRLVAITCIAALAALTAANAQEWKQTDGAATDIGVGANGAVFVPGTNPAPGGYRIWRRDGSVWKATQAGGLRVAVGPDGAGWVVNNTQDIFKLSADGETVTQ